MAWTQADVDAIDTAMKNIAADGYAKLEIGGRSGERLSLSQLVELRNEAVKWVVQEDTSRQSISLVDVRGQSR